MATFTVPGDYAEAFVRTLLMLQDAGDAIDRVTEAVPPAEHPVIAGLNPLRGQIHFAVYLMGQVIPPDLLQRVRETRAAEREGVDALLPTSRVVPSP